MLNKGVNALSCRHKTRMAGSWNVVQTRAKLAKVVFPGIPLS